MKKFLRITADIVAALVIFITVVPLVLSLVLQIGAVQNFIVQRFAAIASDKLETSVSVGRVDIRFPYHAVIDDFVVIDPVDGDTLLGVERLDAGIDVRSLFKGSLLFTKATVNGGALYLNQDSTMTLNLKLVLDKFINRNRPRNPKPFRMGIKKIEIDSFNFAFRKFDPMKVEYGVNFQDMQFNNISLRADDFSLSRDTVAMSVKHISLTEKSSLELRELSADSLYLCPSTIRLSDARFDLEGRTTGHIKSYAMHFEMWNMSDYVNDVRMDVIVPDARIDMTTISKFARRKLPMTAVFKIKGAFHGTVADMAGRVEKLDMEGAEVENLTFTIKGLPDIKRTRFGIRMPKMELQSKDIYGIVEGFTGKKLKYSPVISRIGDINAEAEFDGTLGDFISNGKIRTSVGPVSFNVRNIPERNTQKFHGQVSVSDLDMGRLLSVAGLGGMTMKADLDIHKEADSVVLQTKGVIDSVEYRGYEYRGITIDGSWSNNTFRGFIGSEDRNLNFDFNGLIEMSEQLPRFNFRLNVKDVDLSLLGVNRRDSISRLSGMISAVGYGNDIDNLNGNISVDSLRYLNHIDTIRTGRIAIMTRNNEQNKLLRLTSNFADLELKGHQSYRNIFGYLKNSVRKYLPALQDSTIQAIGNKITATVRGPLVEADGGVRSRQEPEEVAANSYYIARLDVKQANNVAGIFAPGLNMAEGTSLSFLFNPARNHFSLSMNSDYIIKGENLFSGINIDCRSDADSISLFARANEIMSGRLYFPDVSLLGSIKDNSVGVQCYFKNRDDGSAAFISTRSDFVKNTERGLTELRIKMLPGYVSLPKQTWRIAASETVLDSTGVKVNDFAIFNGNQRISLDGKMSRKNTDTLDIKISEFNLSPLSMFVDTLGYKVGGVVDGRVNLISIFRDPYFLSDIAIKGLSLNDHVYADTRLYSRYNEADRAVEYVMSVGDSLRLIDGTLRLGDGSYRADINMPDVDLSVISPMMKGIASGTKGAADIDLVLTSKDGFPNLNGTVNVRNFETEIDFTKVRYRVSGVATVKDNMVSMTGATVTDELGTKAAFEASVSHNRFRRANYRIKVSPRNMLCMNTTSKDNDLFFGRIFASGEVTIEGRGRAVTMQVNATTDENSTFNMPLSDKSTMTEADFITFVKPQVEDENRARSLIRQRRKRSSSAASFDISMALRITPGIYAQIVIDPTIGDIIKVRGNGQLFVNAKPKTGEFSIDGSYEIVDGGYLFTLRNLINKYFTIEQGSTIKWTGDPLAADLDITATYNVKASLAPLLGNNDNSNFQRRVEVDCNINLTGQLLHPDVQLGIVVPDADPETQSMIASVLNTEEAVSLQLFWLLLGNTFYADSSTQSESSVNVGLANSAAVTGLEFLSNQIGNWLSNDKFNLGFSYRPKDATNSDELELSFSAPLLKDKLYLDAEGNVNFKNNTAYINEDVNNLSGDASLTWILDNSGNIRMKAFTRQINTFDENQGLQESGVGVYYKEDFNRFGDVVRKFRTQWDNHKEQRRIKLETIDSIGRQAYKDSLRNERRREREESRAVQQAIKDASQNY